MRRFILGLTAFLSFLLSHSLAIILDVKDRQSILEAATLKAYNVLQLYNGNETGGVLGKFPYPPYYWWESGGAWGGMVEYWHYTRDDSHINVTYDALIAQLGPNYDFNMPVEAFDEGNDDQAFWVFAAMSAAEYSFPEPPAPIPSWITIVQNAWEDYVSRWNIASCNGGLKWQFYPQNAGYFYKNSISNGAFFQISARLARFTGNNTYLDWANTIWDWTSGVGLIDNIYNVFDGTDETINCSRVDHHQWTYNVGVFLYGAAILQNYTNGSAPWPERTAGLLDAATTFITPFRNATNIIFEAECELDMSCNVDQLSMKAYLVRWLAATSLVAPFTTSRVGEILRSSAEGAAAACTGGASGNSCGSKWYIGGWDGTDGLGQELCAMEAMAALMVNDTNPPATLPNVVIQTASPTSTPTPTSTSSTNPATTERPPTPTDTSRPLYDSKASGGMNVQNKIRAVLATIITSLVVV